MADGSNITDATSASIVTHPREQMRLLREKLAEAAQRLIDAMDAMDGDPDFEPSLGSLGSSASNAWGAVPVWSGGNTDDREEEFDGREDGADLEPSLGSPNLQPYASQEQWAPRTRKVLGGDWSEIDLESDFAQTAGQAGENQEYSWLGIVNEGDVLDTHEGEDNEDREPEGGDDCGDAPFALNQEGTNWAYGDDRTNAKPYMRPAEAGAPLHVLDKLRKDREQMAGQKSEIDDFKSDGKGNASFVKDGAPWIGTRLTTDAK